MFSNFPTHLSELNDFKKTRSKDRPYEHEYKLIFISIIGQQELSQPSKNSHLVVVELRWMCSRQRSFAKFWINRGRVASVTHMAPCRELKKTLEKLKKTLKSTLSGNLWVTSQGICPVLPLQSMSTQQRRINWTRTGASLIGSPAQQGVRYFFSQFLVSVYVGTNNIFSEHTTQIPCTSQRKKLSLML